MNIKSFNQIPEIECLSGDTLDTMEISVEGLENLTSPTMHAVISKRGVESSILVKKECTMNAYGTGFTVVIDSNDTTQLRGAYWLDFILTADNLTYKRLRGCLVVYPQYKGA
ncbi:MAG: hypothetical protein IJH64_00585 [Oscillospiraceae bacterium]|nr:hypothetical protein [Oscillospiraceae bacterium]